MTDYKELLDELRSKWLFPRNIEAADLIERLIRERDEAKRERDEALEYTQAIRDHCMKERDEARAKAIDEAAAAFRRGAPGMMLAGDVDRVEAYILALREKPDTIIIDEASEMTPEKWDYVQSRLKDKP
jgi:hypothetical protein